MNQRPAGHLARLRALAASALLLAGCASLPPGAALPKPTSSALAASLEDTLGKTFESAARAHDGASGFHLLSTGVDGLTARVALIDAAQRSVDVQSFIFRADESGTLIARALLRAADRGVRVRILVDDGDTVAGDEKILSLTARPGIEVRIFNPFRYRGHYRLLRGAEFLLGKSRLDYRMHNKLMVGDNALALIGGRNIGDQYFQIAVDSQFGDDDVEVAGPMVQRLSGVFDQFWNSDMAVPAKAIDHGHTAVVAFAAATAAEPGDRAQLARTVAEGPPGASRNPLLDLQSGRENLVWSQVKLAYDSPDKRDIDRGNAAGRLIYKAVADEASRVSEEMLMITPYFVPSRDELAVLKGERDRHARVRILTNSLVAAPELAAQSGYMHYRAQLLAEGIELHEVRALLGSARGSGQARAISRHGNYALHAKQYIFDRKSLFIGSMNFDQRSKHLNTEIGLIIASPEVAQEAARRFEALTRLENAYEVRLVDAAGGKPRLVWRTVEAGTPVEYPTEPARSEWQRLKVELLSLLPLDDEL